MEWVVFGLLNSSITDKLDLLQYKAQWGVEDACLTLLDMITKNMDHPHSCSRILFMDLSSAFNTVKISTLLNRLTELQVNSILINWIKDFLQDRPQHVTINAKTSHNIVLDLSRVYPASRPMTAGIGSSPPVTQPTD